jgi:HAD superfamily hydrolase (TIGR01509 family)
MLRHLQGIIFDLDGTLVDSQLDFAAMRRETGCPEGVGLLEFVEALEQPAHREQALAIIHHHEMAGAKAARWMPGAEAAVLALRNAGLPIGVVTRNSRAAAEHTFKALRVPPIDLVTREDARPKPDPDGLLQLAKRWRLVPSTLAYVGDFRFDLEAAQRAGMSAILYLQPDNAGYASGADLVISHFDELLELLPLTATMSTTRA